MVLFNNINFQLSQQAIGMQSIYTWADARPHIVASDSKVIEDMLSFWSSIFIGILKLRSFLIMCNWFDLLFKGLYLMTFI